jgi:hypothetical protein
MFPKRMEFEETRAQSFAYLLLAAVFEKVDLILGQDFTAGQRLIIEYFRSAPYLAAHDLPILYLICVP